MLQWLAECVHQGDGLFTLAIGVEFILRGLSTVYRQLNLATPMG